MKYGLHHTLERLWNGQTLTRIGMNALLSNQTLRGHVLDIGGGHNPDYFAYFQRTADAEVHAEDLALTGIDFEKDLLPYPDASTDTVILCNILEHMFNYMFLLHEIRRVMKPSAQLIGFVPFWVGYHADPHDYFRYTHEGLERILTDAGFKEINIEKVGAGPILANFNTIVLSLPRIVRPIVYLPYAGLDRIFLLLRPNSTQRYPLGFIFTAR